jgi:hypothetical protein
MALKFSRNILAVSTMALALSPAATTMAQAQSNGYEGNAPPSAYPDTQQESQDSNAPPPGYSDSTQQRYSNAPQQGYSDAPQQGYNNAPPQGYSDAPQQGYNNAPPQGYAGAPPQSYADIPPPPGYNGSQPPPPPPGYQPSAADLAQQDRDARYAADAERWSRDNCVKSQGNVGAGAVIGGIFGAIVGNGLSGRHDRGAGTVAGAAVGAVGGAAIASSAGSNQTSPGCPPGYVVRHNAPPYGYGSYVYDTDYYYAAPGWYQPWVFVGDAWSYRPYPYHNWYYRNYRANHGGWGRGSYYGRGGYGRGGYGRGGYRRP